MAESTSRRGVRYYFRIEFSTLQGKITSGFCLLGIFAIILMMAAYWVLNPALEKSQYVATILQPSKYQLLQLSSESRQLLTIVNERVKSEKTITAAEVAEAKSRIQAPLDSLLELSSSWQLETSRMELKVLALKTGSLLQKVTKLTSTDNNSQQRQLLNTEIEPLQRTLAQLTQTITKQHQAQQASAQMFIISRTKNLLWVLIGCIILATVVGSTLGSIIVVSVLSEIRKLKHKILELSEGKLIAPIPASKNEINSISKAVNTLTDNLRNIQVFAKEVGKGNFDTNIQVFDGQNELGEALAGMRDSLKTVAMEEKQRSWAASGLAHFSELLRASTEDLTTYYQKIISEVVRHLRVNQAAIYVLEETEGGQPRLELKASYAYGRLKHEQKVLAPGQSLAGQVFLEQEPIFLKNLPQDYLQISSGLGDASPGFLAIVPLKVNETTNGVLEIASFKEMAKHETEFLLKLCENISAALQHVNSMQITSRLLMEAQEMASAMQMQEEMLRQNSEELIATQEKLSRDLQETNLQLQLYEQTLQGVAIPQLLLTQEGNILMASAAANNLFGKLQPQQNISSHLQLPALADFLTHATDGQQSVLPYKHTALGSCSLQLQAFSIQRKVYISLQLLNQTTAQTA